MGRVRDWRSGLVGPLLGSWVLFCCFVKEEEDEVDEQLEALIVLLNWVLVFVFGGESFQLKNHLIFRFLLKDPQVPEMLLEFVENALILRTLQKTIEEFLPFVSKLDREAFLQS